MTQKHRRMFDTAHFPSWYRAVLLAMFAVMASPARLAAGDLTVEVQSRAGVAASAEVKSRDTAFPRTATDGRWAFDLRSRPAISIPVSITVPSPPAGYQSEQMNFQIPFFADRDQDYPLATAIANDPTSDLEGVGPFLAEMGQPGFSYGSSSLLYQRASRLWQERLKQLANRGPNGDDVGIAYWLLFAAADLAKQYYYQPGNTVLEAAAWMSKLPNRAFLYQSVPRATVDTLLKQLQGSNATIYEAAIGRLQAARSTDRDFACSRFRRPDSDFNTFTDPEKARIDPAGSLTLRIKESVTWCAAQLASNAAKPGAGLTDEQTQDIRSTVDAARSAIGTVPGPARTGTNARFIQQNIKIIESIVGKSK
ncbi:hypothetical protein [Rhizobium sp. SGZ-381]|uniref:hypothetical protein n=1 Tax=Rhizobium sp. SGZ-381 TaxID=3342800 RepID=UPI00366CC372